MGVILGALRGINLQGWVGVIVGALLGSLLVIQTGKTHHWKKQSARFELAFTQEQSAHRQTVINYRTAAEKARQADLANKAKVEADQRRITQERDKAYEARIADARARARSVRGEDARPGTYPSGPGTAHLPGVPDAPGGPDGAAPEARLPGDDALIATEQAIQLDELQRWVRDQQRVDLNGAGHQ